MMVLPLLFVVATSPPPGAYDSRLTTAQVCVYGESSQRRRTTEHVSYRVKDKIYNAYGIARGHRREFVIDHLIPLELGGTSDPKNLWPQERLAAHKKDLDENALHEQVCRHGMTLQKARWLMIDWWGKQ